MQGLKQNCPFFDTSGYQVSNAKSQTEKKLQFFFSRKPLTSREFGPEVGGRNSTTNLD